MFLCQWLLCWVRVGCGLARHRRDTAFPPMLANLPGWLAVDVATTACVQAGKQAGCAHTGPVIDWLASDTSILLILLKLGTNATAPTGHTHSHCNLQKHTSLADS